MVCKEIVASAPLHHGSSPHGLFSLPQRVAAVFCPGLCLHVVEAHISSPVSPYGKNRDLITIVRNAEIEGLGDLLWGLIFTVVGMT